MFEALYRTLNARRPRWKTEEEVRLAWVHGLESSLGIELHAERERRDSSYNNVVIEFKSPGLFRGQTTSPAFVEAVQDRLKPYILAAAERDGLDPADYIGIAIDGNHVAFVQVRGTEATHGPLMPFSEASTAMVAFALRDNFRRAVSAENLIQDFGHESASGISLMSALAGAVSHALSVRRNKVRMLFEEWRSLFGQVADLTSEQIERIQSGFRFTVEAEKADRIPASLFVIHTYNSLVIKLLAAEIVSSHGLTSYRDFAQQTAALDDAALARILDSDIERGEFYARAGVKGFAEEAIFSWYLAAPKEHRSAILQGIRTMLVQLALYRTDRLTAARSKDVIKRFYQDLVPETLRKSLGEFYTPDWLVHFVLDKANHRDWLLCRVLDPTCGSGSFLLETIRRKRLAAEKAGWSASKTVQHIVENVWGFDLNPLAVLSARVNFLIAVADLLQAEPGEQIELPILLADAIYSPAADPQGDEAVVTYRIGSERADLEINLPTTLAFDRRRLDGVFEVMGEAVAEGKEYAEAAKQLVGRSVITAEEKRSWERPLKATYERVLELHRSNWNGIWFRIVRNFFWSATAGCFDVVIGNPPWVRWSKLPELYRQRVKPTCEFYEIFSPNPYHGGNELDISAIITYAVADKWLKSGGVLAFVITQTHFQSPSSEGFRDFCINDEDRLIPLSVDDLKALKPFPDAANKTAVALFRKDRNQNPAYPVPYHVWQAKSGFPAVIPVHLTLQEVLDRVETLDREATPVNEGASPWCILPPGRYPHVSRLVGDSSWVNGRKGITADLNGVYFVEVLERNQKTGLVKVATRPEAGKTDIGPRQTFWVEPTLLYPLLKGASDFEACRLTRGHTLFAFVPNNGITREAYEAAQQRMDAELPHTRKYFEAFRAKLTARSTYRTRMPSAPYYAVYNVGSYTFAPWKVIWAEQKSFCSAVAGSGPGPLTGTLPFVPDHKLFFADFSDEQTAYFLCGLLNAELVKEFVECHNIGIQLGDIFKHMSLPRYVPNNLEHRRLAQKTKEAHTESDGERHSARLAEVRRLAEAILDSSSTQVSRD